MTDGDTDTEYDDVQKSVSETEDKVVIKWKCKRGDGTRDEDKFSVKVKGDDVDEVAEKLKAAQGHVARRMRTARAVGNEEGDEI